MWKTMPELNPSIVQMLVLLCEAGENRLLLKHDLSELKIPLPYFVFSCGDVNGCEERRVM